MRLSPTHFRIFTPVDRERVDQYITKTCPCNIEIFFSAVKNGNFIGFFFFIFLIFLLKTLIVIIVRTASPSGSNADDQHVCFRAKIRKIGILLHTPVLLYISGE